MQQRYFRGCKQILCFLCFLQCELPVGLSVELFVCLRGGGEQRKRSDGKRRGGGGGEGRKKREEFDRILRGAVL